jgi:hypothetical protein
MTDTRSMRVPKDGSCCLQEKAPETVRALGANLQGRQRVGWLSEARTAACLRRRQRVALRSTTPRADCMKIGRCEQ